MTERTCKKCGETKPFDQFTADKKAHGGRGHTCHDCRRAQRRQDEGPPPNARVCTLCGTEKPLALFSRDRTQRWGFGPRCRDCDRERRQAWRDAGGRSVNQPETQARYNEETREWRSTVAAVTCAELRGARIVEHVSPLVVLERDDGLCGICGEDVDPLDYHLDHIEPCRAGGDHSYENVQLAHPICNVRKATEDKKAAAA